MKGIALWALVTCAACSSVPPDSDVAPSTASTAGRVVVSYEEPKSKDLAATKAALQSSRAVDELGDWVSGFLALPADLPVTFKECGEQNAWYEAGKITICYDYMKLFSDLAAQNDSGRTGREVTAFMVNNAKETFTHELGHAAVDMFHLPITGREEDVADQMSAYLLTQNKEDAEVLLDAAEGYWLASTDAVDDVAFADSHSLEQQRAFNFACWLYGSDPKNHKDLVGDDWLPQSRAADCATEYDQLVQGWSTLLEPHRR